MARKLIALLLVGGLLLLVVPVATGVETDEIVTIVEQYFSDRESFLLGNADTIPNVVEGIVTDEAAHIEKTEENKLTRSLDSVTVRVIGCWDSHAEVTVLERVIFTQFETEYVKVIFHQIQLLHTDDGSMIVASDAYLDGVSGFQSCSYNRPGSQDKADTNLDDDAWTERMKNEEDLSVLFNTMPYTDGWAATDIDGIVGKRFVEEPTGFVRALALEPIDLQEFVMGSLALDMYYCVGYSGNIDDFPEAVAAIELTDSDSADAYYVQNRLCDWANEYWDIEIPKTGDYIDIAVALMAVSLGALIFLPQSFRGKKIK